MTEPVFMASVFKGGTWLVRRIVALLTGLEPDEPERVEGKPDYGNPALIRFRPGHFFSWHSFMTQGVVDLLVERQVRPILVMRNLYDLTVSMYHHFADDIDAEKGFSAGQAAFFKDYSRDEGLAMVIAGYKSRTASFDGAGEHYAQMQGMILYSAHHDALLVSYDRLLQDRPAEVLRIAKHLGIYLTRPQLDDIVAASGFQRMKQEAESAGGGSHFRVGQAGAGRLELKPMHLFMIEQQLSLFAPHLRPLARAAGYPEVVSCDVTVG